jgi:hypothetical protein
MNTQAIVRLSTGSPQDGEQKEVIMGTWIFVKQYPAFPSCPPPGAGFDLRVTDHHQNLFVESSKVTEQADGTLLQHICFNRQFIDEDAPALSDYRKDEWWQEISFDEWLKIDL